MTCKDCKYSVQWVGHMRQGLECRRFPPQMEKWPRIPDDGWCGEYQKFVPAPIPTLKRGPGRPRKTG